MNPAAANASGKYTFSRLWFCYHAKLRLRCRPYDCDCRLIPAITSDRYLILTPFFFLFNWAHAFVLSYTAAASWFVQLAHCHVVPGRLGIPRVALVGALRMRDPLSSSLCLNHAHIHHTHNWNRTECKCTRRRYKTHRETNEQRASERT